jgi:hypothetical protein
MLLNSSVPSTLLCVLLSYNLYLFMLYDHQYKLVIISLCGFFLSQENKTCYRHKIHLSWSFLYLCIAFSSALHLFMYIGVCPSISARRILTCISYGTVLLGMHSVLHDFLWEIVYYPLSLVNCFYHSIFKSIYLFFVCLFLLLLLVFIFYFTFDVPIVKFLDVHLLGFILLEFIQLLG